MLGPCKFDPAQHHIIHPPMEQALKAGVHSKADRDSLFVYHHKHWGTFVIAFWTSKIRGEFVDMINLEWSLNNLTREHLVEVHSKLNYPAHHHDSFLSNYSHLRGVCRDRIERECEWGNEYVAKSFREGRMPVHA